MKGDGLSPSAFLISKMEGMDDVTQVLIVTRTGEGEISYDCCGQLAADTLGMIEFVRIAAGEHLRRDYMVRTIVYPPARKRLCWQPHAWGPRMRFALFIRDRYGMCADCAGDAALDARGGCGGCLPGCVSASVYAAAAVCRGLHVSYVDQPDHGAYVPGGSAAVWPGEQWGMSPGAAASEDGGGGCCADPAAGADRFGDMLRGLTPLQRQMLEMAYVEDMPAAEMAAALGASVVQVKSRLRVAKRRARKNS